jgi:hypothetical protein
LQCKAKEMVQICKSSIRLIIKIPGNQLIQQNFPEGKLPVWYLIRSLEWKQVPCSISPELCESRRSSNAALADWGSGKGTNWNSWTNDKARASSCWTEKKIYSNWRNSHQYFLSSSQLNQGKQKNLNLWIFYRVKTLK